MFILRKHGHTVRTPQILDRRMMTSATSYTIHAGIWPFRVCLIIGCIRCIPVQTPFFYIAMHIIKSESVRRSLSYLQGNWFIVSGNHLIPAHGFRQIISCIIIGIGTCPTSVFPFRFGRQTVGLPFFFTQPITEIHRILISDIHHCIIIVYRNSIFSPQSLMFRTELFKLRVCHFCFPHPKSM